MSLKANNFIDLTTKGRDEDSLLYPMAWVRHHDKYGDPKALDAIIFFFQAKDGIRYLTVTGVQTCALPISAGGQLRQPLALAAQERSEAESVVQLRQRRHVGQAAPEPGGRDLEREIAGDAREPAGEVGIGSCRGEGISRVVPDRSKKNTAKA